MSVNEKMTAIADAIRGYGSITGKLNLDDMANKIGTVYLNGYDLGRVQGEEAGFSEGVQQGYGLGFEEGKQAEYDAFWDAYQQNGKRVDYTHGFGGGGWTTELFKPKYNIKPTAAYMMFRYTNMEIDLVEYLENLGIILDFSDCNQIQYGFYGSRFRRLGKIDLRKMLGSTMGSNLFDGCTNLKTVDLLIVKENLTMNMFNNCLALENLTIEGTIGKDINLQWSTKLNKASIESIINALSSATSGLTVTLSKTAVNNAFTAEEWEALEATKTNWTISLV